MKSTTKRVSHYLSESRRHGQSLNTKKMSTAMGTLLSGVLSITHLSVGATNAVTHSINNLNVRESKE
jgi:hypothetical protein